MLSPTRNTPVDPRGPGVIQDTASAQPSAAADRETRRDRSHRKAHRSRLHAYAVMAVALVALLIVLAVSNTAPVKVNWIFGSSHVSLVWLVLSAAILGWLLGLVATGAFHWRTRAPRRAQRQPGEGGGAASTRAASPRQ